MNIHLRLSNLLKHGSFVVGLQKRGRCAEGGIGAEEGICVGGGICAGGIGAEEDFCVEGGICTQVGIRRKHWYGGRKIV